MAKMTRKEYLAKCRAKRLEMAKLRNAGWTLKEIGDKFGLRYQAVQSALKNV